MAEFVHQGRRYRENGDGTVTDIGPAGARTIGQPDPTGPFQAPQAGADLEKTQADIADTAEDNRRENLKIAADLYKQGLRVNGQGQIEAIPQGEWVQPAADVKRGEPLEPMKRAQINSVIGQINRVQELYASGPGATKRARGLADYLPTDANVAFNTAGAGLAEQGLAAFRVPGVGAQSDTELRQFVEANRPSAGDRDVAIQEKLGNLRRRIEEVRAAHGLEPAEWITEGLPEGEIKEIDQRRSVWQNTQEFVSNDPLLAAASNPDTQSIPIPQAMQDEHRAFIASGNWTPEQYAEFRVGLDRKYADQLTRLGADYEVDTGPNMYAEYLDGGKRIRTDLDRGANIGDIPAMEAPMSLLDTIRNMGANNPASAAAISALNMGGFGGVEALAPEQYAALEGQYPLSTLGGEVGGAILGTSMLGKAGREAAGLLPRGGARLRDIMGREGSFKRNLATDATYGAGYGTVTEGDPLNSGIAAGAGSTLGQLVGKVAGATVGGVRQSDAVQRLLAEGIPLSPMRRLGPFAAKVEDAATSIPITGDLIEARARDSMGGFDRAAFKEAYSRAGAVPRGIAEEGIGQGRVIQSDVYRQALGGRSFNANDPAFIEAVKKDLAQAANLPTLGEETTYIIRDAIEPFVDQSGQISGENLQAALQTLTRAAGTMGKSQSAIGPRAADVLRGAKGSVEDMAGRQAPDVIPALEDANYTYRMGETLRDAVSAAKNREGVFTPAQLGIAAEKNARRYGNNAGTAERPFFSLQRAGQEVLPSKINDSGTGRRLIQATALGTGAGALTGAASSNDALGGAQAGAGYGAAAPVTLGALLALLNTRKGQSALNALLFKRGDLPKNLGRIIRDQQGLLGSASVPLMIGAGQ